MRRILLLLAVLLFGYNQLFAQVSGEYRSKQNGNWSDPATWQVFNGTSWVDAASAPSNDYGHISIRSDHTVTVTADVFVDDIKIDTFGILKINPGVTFHIVDDPNIQADCENYGDIVIEGKLKVSGELHNRSTASIEGSGPWSLDLSQGTLYNEGRFDCLGNDPAMIISSQEPSFIINIEEGSIMKTNPGSLTINTQVTNSGKIDLSGPVVLNGIINNLPVASINCYDPGIDITGTGTLNTSGTMNFNMGSRLSTGSFVTINISNGAIGGFSNTPFKIRGILNVTGTGMNPLLANPINIESGGVCNYSATNVRLRAPFVIETGGEMHINATSTFNPGLTIQSTGSLSNFGTTSLHGPIGSVINFSGVGTAKNEVGGLWLVNEPVLWKTTSGTFESRGLLKFDDPTPGIEGQCQLEGGAHFYNYADCEINNEDGFRFWGNGTTHFNGGNLHTGDHTDLVVWETSTEFIGTVVAGEAPILLKGGATFNDVMIGTVVHVDQYGIMTIRGTQARFSKDVVVDGTLSCPDDDTEIWLDGDGSDFIVNGYYNVDGENVSIDETGTNCQFILSETGSMACSSISSTYVRVPTHLQGDIEGSGTWTFTDPVVVSVPNYKPGNSPGILAIESQITPIFNPNTSLTIEIVDPFQPVGVGFDRFVAIGNTVLSGELIIEEPFVPVPPGFSFQVITCTGTLSGSFTSVTQPGGYAIQYNASNVTLVKGNLPVILINFTAKKEGNNKALLQWKTATEQNASHFDILRSNDGSNFLNIGKMLAAGNSNSIRAYDFIDENPKTGLNYYRLNQVDFDGKSSLSKIVQVDFSKLVDMKVQPNPAKDFIMLNGSHAFHKIEIFNSSGKKVKSILPNYSNKYDITDLLPGIYFLRLYNGKESITSKFVKH